MSLSVLVTGSSRGIGRAVAMHLAADGYEVVLHCRAGVSAAEGVRDEIRAAGGQARIVQFDVTDREQAARVLLADIEVSGAYYGVVCNAGITADAAFPAMSGEAWDSVVHTNLDGFFNVLNPIIMPMIRRRKPGRIVVMSSVSGIMGNRGQVNYSASKAGLIGATKALALELGKRSITVNCVAPGVIESEMTASLDAEQMINMIPARRFGEAREVAATVSFLMSEGAGYITRQVIAVNGGLC